MDNFNSKIYAILFLVFFVWMLAITYIQLNQSHKMSVVEQTIEEVRKENEKVMYMVEQTPDTVVININNYIRK